MPIDLQYFFEQITQREELEAELGSITVDEPPTLNKSMVEQRIRDKEHAQHVLELERKRLNEENERMMIAMDREQKRSMTVKTTHFLHNLNLTRFSVIQVHEDEIPTKPKQPMIDRSVKPVLPPVIPPVIPSAVTQRNFAPEYGAVMPGLTGLKNLGNTCYMNSIIQCLSNVVELCKYFRSGHFKSHLNR